MEEKKAAKAAQNATLFRPESQKVVKVSKSGVREDDSGCWKTGKRRKS